MIHYIKQIFRGDLLKLAIEKTSENSKKPKSKSKIDRLYTTTKQHICSLTENMNLIREKSKDLKSTNLELGIFHLANNNLTDASFRFWLLSRFFEEDPLIHYYRGRTYLKKKALDKAKEDFEKASSIDKSNEDIKYQILKCNNPDQIKEIPATLVTEERQMKALIPTSDIDRAGYTEFYKHLAKKLLKNIDDKNPNMTTALLQEDTGILTKTLKDKDVIKEAQYYDYAQNSLNTSKELKYHGESLYEYISDTILPDLKSLKNKAYDLIVSNRLNSNFRNPAQYIAHIKPSLKKSGHFVLIYKENTNTHLKDSFDLYNDCFLHSEKDLIEALKKEGFEISYASLTDKLEKTAKKADNPDDEEIEIKNFIHQLQYIIAKKK